MYTFYGDYYVYLYVYIIMCNYLCVYLVMCDYLCVYKLMGVYLCAYIVIDDYIFFTTYLKSTKRFMYIY